MTVTIADVAVVAIGGLIVWITGYAYGYHLGCIDTERRWSEAVGRADEARRYARETDAIAKFDAALDAEK